IGLNVFGCVDIAIAADAIAVAPFGKPAAIMIWVDSEGRVIRNNCVLKRSPFQVDQTAAVVSIGVAGSKAAGASLQSFSAPERSPAMAPRPAAIVERLCISGRAGPPHRSF